MVPKSLLLCLKGPSTVSYLIQVYPDHTLTNIFFKIHFNTNIPSMFNFPK
jgi:hypothetical protein